MVGDGKVVGCDGLIKCKCPLEVSGGGKEIECLVLI